MKTKKRDHFAQCHKRVFKHSRTNRVTSLSFGQICLAIGVVPVQTANEQVLHCLSFRLPLLDEFLYGKPHCYSEPVYDKTNEMICVPIEDLEQPGLPPSLIRVFAVHSVGS